MRKNLNRYSFPALSISDSQSVLAGLENAPISPKDGVVGQEAFDQLPQETLNMAGDRDPAAVPLPPPTPGEESQLADTPELAFPLCLTVLIHSLHWLLSRMRWHP
jgi:hypothetical protein